MSLIIGELENTSLDNMRVGLKREITLVRQEKTNPVQSDSHTVSCHLPNIYEKYNGLFPSYITTKEMEGNQNKSTIKENQRSSLWTHMLIVPQIQPNSTSREIRPSLIANLLEMDKFNRFTY